MRLTDGATVVVTAFYCVEGDNFTFLNKIVLLFLGVKFGFASHHVQGFVCFKLKT